MPNWLRQRIRPTVTATILAIVIVGLGTLIFTAVLVVSQPDTPDQLSAAAVVLTGGTFTLAWIGAGLAAFAYAQSIKRPRISVEVALDFIANEGEDGIEEVKPLKRTVVGMNGLEFRDARGLTPVHIQVLLANHGDASSRNIMVTVELSGMQTWIRDEDIPPGWSIVQNEIHTPLFEFQWDGGADLAVHPAPVPPRRLPAIYLPVNGARPGETVRAVAWAYADGCEPDTDTFEIRVAQTPS